MPTTATRSSSSSTARGSGAATGSGGVTRLTRYRATAAGFGWSNNMVSGSSSPVAWDSMSVSSTAAIEL